MRLIATVSLEVIKYWFVWKLVGISKVSWMKSSAKEGKMIAATGDDGLREI